MQGPCGMGVDAHVGVPEAVLNHLGVRPDSGTVGRGRERNEPALFDAVLVSLRVNHDGQIVVVA
jgi:hypothetical protein